MCVCVLCVLICAVIALLLSRYHYTDLSAAADDDDRYPNKVKVGQGMVTKEISRKQLVSSHLQVAHSPISQVAS